jgi:hypothetical protein
MNFGKETLSMPAIQKSWFLQVHLRENNMIPRVYQRLSNRNIATLLIASGALIFQGCKAEAPFACSNDDNCNQPAYCHQSVCINAECSEDSDCLDERHCLGSRCTLLQHNLITNGGFESDFLGWSTQTSGTANFTVDTNEKYSQNKSAKIEILVANDYYLVQFMQIDIPAVKDKKYFLKFKAKADQSRQIKVHFHQNTSPFGVVGKFDAQGNIVNLTTDWQIIKRTLTATETVSNNTRLFFTATTGTVFWLDDVEFYELP